MTTVFSYQTVYLLDTLFPKLLFKFCNFSRSEQRAGCSGMARAELCSFICCKMALWAVRHHISEHQKSTALQTTDCWSGKAAYHSLPALSLRQPWLVGLVSPLLPRKGSGLVGQAVAGVCSSSKLSPSHILSSFSLGRSSRARSPSTSHCHLPSQLCSSLTSCLPILFLQQQ